jgi:syntaxin 7
MEEFQDIQKDSLQKSREFVIKAQAIDEESRLQRGGDSKGASRVEEYLPVEESLANTAATDKTRLLQGSNEAVALENEISYNQALIQEREHGIQEIEAAMAEVHEIFCDLGLLVSDQQTFVDNIEANIESSAVRTRAAVRELVIARDRQRRRRGNIICLLFLAIFVAVMALAIINAVY